MSRPPAHFQNTYPQVVNGGLIDFQDNQLRGPCDFGMTSSGLSTPGTCITGPPSFIHVNGITYRPVDETQETVKASTVSSSASTSVKSSAPASDSLDEEIERRVQVKVDEYLSRQAGRSSSSRPEERRANTNAPPEDEVARRLQRVNENMRQFKSSGRDDKFISNRNW